MRARTQDLLFSCSGTQSESTTLNTRTHAALVIHQQVFLLLENDLIGRQKFCPVDNANSEMIFVTTKRSTRFWNSNVRQLNIMFTLSYLNWMEISDMNDGCSLDSLQFYWNILQTINETDVDLLIIEFINALETVQ